MFVVHSGDGTVRAGDENSSDQKPAKYLSIPPGEPHQLTNTGKSDLVVLIIAGQSPTRSRVTIPTPRNGDAAGASSE